MHYLSLLAQLKNETMNLKVWLDHYLWQGVDHFYLIDNGSDDDPLSILQEYIDNGSVTYFYLPEKYNQFKHYSDVFDRADLKQKSVWLIVCDLDEFFFGVNHKLSREIQKLENDYDYILCNWNIFGSDGLEMHPPDIRTAITHCDKNLWTSTKYIVKTNNVQCGWQVGIHSLINHSPPPDRICNTNTTIQLNHYVIQSLEFFKKVKMPRGDATSPSADAVRNMDYFEKHDYREIQDETLKNIILTPPPFYH
jgi:hypothetical protein